MSTGHVCANPACEARTESWKEPLCRKCWYTFPRATRDKMIRKAWKKDRLKV